MRRIVVGLAALVLVTSTALIPLGRAHADTKTAETAARQWLSLTDKGSWGPSWDRACKFFQGAVDRDTWTAQIKGVRAPLGAVKSRKLAKAMPQKELPGAPDGDYVILIFQSTFENKKKATETVTVMKEKDGQYRLAGYYIK